MNIERDIYVILILLAIFIIAARWEWVRHLRNLKSIPIRIVVNGTRGKSSVTRLIGAGLRAGGYMVMSKTTGTDPRMLFNNHLEIPIIRTGRANIREQITIFKKAAKEGVNAVVFENMSIRPDLQWTEETKIIQPTMVVITNVRSDHLDVMGPSLYDIAYNFINAVPEGAGIITAECEFFPLMKSLCQKRGLDIIQSSLENAAEHEMQGFSYIEHQENAALALEVCKRFGIDKRAALEEMYKCIPDPGVLRRYELMLQGKRMVLYNALAANDPDSTYIIYKRMEKDASSFYTIINCRDDRVDRSVRMADLINKMPGELYFLTGLNTAVFYRHAIRSGVKKNRLINLGGKNVRKAFNQIVNRVKDDSTILAIGNMVGYGEELIRCFIAEGEK